MKLPSTETYIRRPLMKFEAEQMNNFSSIIQATNKSKNSTTFDIPSIAFLNPYSGRFMMKLIHEESHPGYTLMWLFDIAVRTPNSTLECLVPTELIKKYNLQNAHNVCIEFQKIQKTISAYTSKTTGVTHSYPLVKIEDFKIVNQIQIRSISAKRSLDAQKLRNEILFNEMGIDTDYVKMSVLDSLFLSPMLSSRAGIETNSFVHNEANKDELFILNSYNQLQRNLIPPEISNCHLAHIRDFPIPHKIKSLNETFWIHPDYYQSNHQFDASCEILRSKSFLSNFRNERTLEIGINHQAQFRAHPHQKHMIETMMQSEFYYTPEKLYKTKSGKLDRSFQLLIANQDLLYEDYANRISASIHVSPNNTASQRKKINDLTVDYCNQLGYKVKQGHDRYYHSIRRMIIENLTRAKAIFSRAGVFMGASAGDTYLKNMHFNFQDIIGSDDYKEMKRNEVNLKNINKIMGNSTRSNIVMALKRRGGFCREADLISELSEDNELKDIFKELSKLTQGSRVIARRGEYLQLEIDDI